MKKILKRLFAYMIDIMVVMIITQCLSGIPLINHQLDHYNRYYQEYSNHLKEYTEFKMELQSAFKDEKITEKEYNKLVSISSDYQKYLKEYYDDKKITKNEYNKINKNIDKYYMKNYKKEYYNVERNSVCYFIIYLIVTLFYFVGFNYYTSGQTLGKKLFRLKIVNSRGEGDKVSLLSYLIRGIFLYQPLYYLVKLIGIFVLNSNNYYQITSIFYDINYYLGFIIILTVMIRMDGRGLHDLASSTRVASYDRNGNEIDRETISFVTKRLDEKVVAKKKEMKKKKEESKKN